MRFSREGLGRAAAEAGFRPEVLEKVLLLLDLLEAIDAHPELSGKLALKGGTALNLFLFDVPRLSVDIDLNYIGAADRETAQEERPAVEAAIGQIARRLGLAPQTPKREHAGTSWAMRYRSALGSSDNVKVDINYLFRVPLWSPRRRQSQLAGTEPRSALVLDVNELAAGKLAALLARRTSRDLFDAHELLTKRRSEVDAQRLRQAFVVYGGINIEDWRRIAPSDIDKAARDLDVYLLPMLRAAAVSELGEPRSTWGARLARECREALEETVLPLTEPELSFLNRLLDEGEIEPERFVDDAALAERIRIHPGLLWKALNVRRHRVPEG